MKTNTRCAALLLKINQPFIFLTNHHLNGCANAIQNYPLNRMKCTLSAPTSQREQGFFQSSPLNIRIFIANTGSHFIKLYGDSSAINEYLSLVGHSAWGLGCWLNFFFSFLLPKVSCEGKQVRQQSTKPTF